VGEWIELGQGWFPELVDATARRLTHPAINAHRERIEAMSATNTATTVHQDPPAHQGVNTVS